MTGAGISAVPRAGRTITATVLTGRGAGAILTVTAARGSTVLIIGIARGTGMTRGTGAAPITGMIRGSMGTIGIGDIITGTPDTMVPDRCLCVPAISTARTDGGRVMNSSAAVSRAPVSAADVRAAEADRA